MASYQVRDTLTGTVTPVTHRQRPRPRRGQTLTGYGKSLPTTLQVLFNRRWQSVKVVCFSNAGTAYIGKTWPSNLLIDDL